MSNPGKDASGTECAAGQPGGDILKGNAFGQSRAIIIARHGRPEEITLREVPAGMDAYPDRSRPVSA